MVAGGGITPKLQNLNTMSSTAEQIDATVQSSSSFFNENIVFQDKGTDTNKYTIDVGTISSINNELKVSGTTTYGRCVASFPTVAGRIYKISCLAKKETSFSAILRIGTSSAGANMTDSKEVSTSNTTFTLLSIDNFVATSSLTYFALVASNTGGAVSYFKDIIIQDMDGQRFKIIPNSAYQYQYPTTKNLYDYVLGQEAVCRARSIPILDLYRESGLNYSNKANFISADNLHYLPAGYQFYAKKALEFVRQNVPYGNLSTKTIGVFGGSFSIYSGSEYVKNLWISELGFGSYTNYGVGGAGFAKDGNYIDSQIDTAGVHDVYILWCSTNDCTNSKAIGSITDTTHATQNGGINVCINKIIAKNPMAKILMFNSIKSYASPNLYDITV